MPRPLFEARDEKQLSRFEKLFRKVVCRKMLQASSTGPAGRGLHVWKVILRKMTEMIVGRSALISARACWLQR
jgi:hypothetical protein